MSFRDTCTNAKQLDELHRAVASIDPFLMSPRDVAVVNRAAKRIGITRDFRVAYTGTHSFQPLPEYLEAHAIGSGIGIQSYISPYGQYMQELLDDRSGLIEFRPQLLFISCALRQLAPRVYNEFGSLTKDELRSEKTRILEQLAEVATVASERLGATVLLGNLARPPFPQLGIADLKAECGETEFYLTLNLELLERFKDSARVHIVDLDRLAGGMRRPSAEKMFFMAKSIWTDFQCNAIAQELLRYAIAATGRTRKCLVVDLDNTVWGGVAGEDGPEGVRIGQGSALAEAFESFQYAVRGLRQRGIMIAIASKNNPPDVEAVFNRRDPMPLTLSDFSAKEIGWGDKGSGVLNVAADLNIGTDSLVFADDNPAERAIVRGTVPGVEVLEMPSDPADFADFLRRQVWFEKLKVGEDDVARMQHYSIEQERQRLRTGATNLEQYLRELGTEVIVRLALPSDIPRVHELFNKTNQFNLTTRRYTLAEVERFQTEPKFTLGIASARDNFGEMGTIAVFLLESHGELVRLDSFLMSCRALGRGIETAIMNCVKQKVSQSVSVQRLEATFIPTKRNNPAKDFLGDQGFELLDRTADGSEQFCLLRENSAPIPCEHLELRDEIAQELSPA